MCRSVSTSENLIAWLTYGEPDEAQFEPETEFYGDETGLEQKRRTFDRKVGNTTILCKLLQLWVFVCG